MNAYKWHNKPCKLLVKPIFAKGIKRNALIELADGLKVVIPWRAIRRRIDG